SSDLGMGSWGEFEGRRVDLAHPVEPEDPPVAAHEIPGEEIPVRTEDDELDRLDPSALDRGAGLGWGAGVGRGAGLGLGADPASVRLAGCRTGRRTAGSPTVGDRIVEDRKSVV